MSTKFETPANDGQSNHSSGDDVVNLKLFSCAFDTPPVSSNNDSSSPTNGLGNLFRLSDWASPKSTPATAGGAVDRVMNSLGNMLPQSSDLGSILPKMLIEGSASTHGRDTGCANPSLSNLLNGKSTDGGSAVKPNKPHENGSGLGSIIDNVVPKSQSKPHENGSGLGSIIDNLVPKPQSKSNPGPGSDNSSSPPHGRTPIENAPPGDKSDRSSLPSHGRTPIENSPPGDKTDRSSFPPDGRSPIENKDRIRQPIDRSPKFKYPEDKPLDAKQSDEMADKLSKWIKDSVDKDGNLNLDQNTLDRLKDALQYGISHGEKGLQEMIAKINKKLEGSGIEIKSDGKAFAHFQTCMPDIERGDHLGDFIGFDIMKNGKKVDSNLVKVGSGIFDRLR